MSDIDALAKRIILIGKGKVLYDGSLKKLKENFANKKYITVKTKDNIKLKQKGIIKKEKNKEGYNFIIDAKILNISEFLNIISKKGNIEDIEIDNESLDNMIVNLYGELKI